MIKFLLHVDTQCLGRVDKTTLSEQSIMELLVADLCASGKHTRAFRDEEGNFLPVEEWRGVEVNAYGDVQKIKWKSTYWIRASSMVPQGGTIYFEWIPTQTAEFSATYMAMSGTLDAGVLPHGLVVFDISNNLITGPLETEKLPSTIQTVSVANNQLSGSLDLSSLPPKLESLQAGSNMFTGSVRLENLPQTLHVLELSGNKLSGTIHMGNLPHTLQNISLQLNCIQQETLIFERTPNMQIVQIDTSKIGKIIDLHGNAVELP